MAGLCEGGNEPPGSLKGRYESRKKERKRETGASIHGRVECNKQIQRRGFQLQLLNAENRQNAQLQLLK
ncbi:hypothetical protein ANN_09365 [Periplaneta americana]|uniref:Uncharacterized protein n=1 Tax=Periplaneta americana TaxID=6978 RepID=A0ABQ8TLG7_PERAM|nr:hypothetical protein ANN_09365 [Periplaneta americana]